MRCWPRPRGIYGHQRSWTCAPVGAVRVERRGILSAPARRAPICASFSPRARWSGGRTGAPAPAYFFGVCGPIPAFHCPLAPFRQRGATRSSVCTKMSASPVWGLPRPQNLAARRLTHARLQELETLLLLDSQSSVRIFAPARRSPGYESGMGSNCPDAIAAVHFAVSVSRSRDTCGLRAVGDSYVRT